MPFPLSYKGKIEAWVGANGLDRSNYQSMFVGKLSDELRGMGRQSVCVLESTRPMNIGAPQVFFPQGDVVTFGMRSAGYARFRKLDLSALDGGEVEIELKDEILIVSYHLRFRVHFFLLTAAFLVLLGSWIASVGRLGSTWGIPVIILIFWLIMTAFPYIMDLVTFRKLIKNVVKSVRDDIALNDSLSISGS